MRDGRWVKPKEAAKHYNISSSELRRRASSGAITAKQGESGKHRRYWIGQVAPALLLDITSGEESAELATDDEDAAVPAITAPSAASADILHKLLLGDGNRDAPNVRIKVVDEQKYVSGIDLVSAVCDQNKDHAAHTIRRIFENHPEVSNSSTDFKFSGQGQRDTPCFDARGCVMLINLLPGPKAAAWRLGTADLLVRFLGGDPSLVAEIQRNAEAQEALRVANPQHPARLFGEAVEAASGDRASVLLKRKRDELELDERRENVEERRAKTEKMRMETRFDLVHKTLGLFEKMGTLDDRTKIMLSDYSRSVFLGPSSRSCGPLMLAGEPAGGQEAAPREEVTIEDIALKMGYRRPPQSEIGSWRIRLGRVAARLYRENHSGNDPPTTKRYCNGTIRDVKCYFKSDDIAILEQAVIECMGNASP